MSSRRWWVRENDAVVRAIQPIRSQQSQQHSSRVQLRMDLQEKGERQRCCMFWRRGKQVGGSRVSATAARLHQTCSNGKCSGIGVQVKRYMRVISFFCGSTWRPWSGSIPASFVNCLVFTRPFILPTYMWTRDKEVGNAVIGIQSRACRVLLTSLDLLLSFFEVLVSLSLLTCRRILMAAARSRTATTTADIPATNVILPVSL